MSTSPSGEPPSSESQIGSARIKSELPSPSPQPPKSPVVSATSVHVEPLGPFEAAPQILTQSVPTPSVLTNDILAIADKAISNYFSVRAEHVRNLPSSNLKASAVSFSM